MNRRMESSKLGLIEQSWVREALDELPDNFTITDPSISGHPIVFASVGFCKMSGYPRDEVIGKNGRVFQGPATNRRSVMEIREAVREERSVQINLLNYRKDGTPFWMLFHMVPVFGKEDGSVIHFVAVQVPISRKPRRSSVGSEFCRRNGVDSCETLFGSCRRQVCSDSAVDLSRVLALESDTSELELEVPREASDTEKRRAANAVNNILSVLTHYSELTGRLMCGKRCCLSAMGLHGSSIASSLGRIKQSFVLSDPRLPDMPIVYASDAFLKLTGYARHEVLGRNCRFLSGADTDPSTVFKIKESLQTEQACTVRILNYRKDTTSFWNLLHISPVRNASGKIAYFIAVQIEESCNNQDGQCVSPDMRQLSTVGAVKVAVRTMSMGAGSSKS
uniref:Putative LOV domain-containing protein n=1 Tax=Telesonix jamesii TaxID=46776 RepID=A0A126X076_9MAGN|nr:putative LOV domain-containing protein [Telesonix jamesii]